MRQTGWVRIVITEIGWEGKMRRRALDTSDLADAGRWEDLIEQVLATPPPYRATPGRPVYVIHARERAVLVGEQDLTGPLAGLVEKILETGGPPLAAERAAHVAATAMRRTPRCLTCRQRPEDAAQVPRDACGHEDKAAGYRRVPLTAMHGRSAAAQPAHRRPAGPRRGACQVLGHLPGLRRPQAQAAARAV
jgi:hypothetical protein